MMPKLNAVWHDVDGTKTHHDFETVAKAGEWLESVLSEVGGDEGEFEAWAATNGYEVNPFTKFVYYDDEDRETVGSVEFYRDGQFVAPYELHDLSLDEE